MPTFCNFLLDNDFPKRTLRINIQYYDSAPLRRRSLKC